MGPAPSCWGDGYFKEQGAGCTFSLWSKPEEAVGSRKTAEDVCHLTNHPPVHPISYLPSYLRLLQKNMRKTTCHQGCSAPSLLHLDINVAVVLKYVGQSGNQVLVRNQTALPEIWLNLFFFNNSFARLNYPKGEEYATKLYSENPWIL